MSSQKSSPGATPATRILIDALTSYLRFGTFVVVFFFLTPVMLQALGPRDFGLWTLVFSVMGFLGLLDFGLATGVVRFVAEARGKGDTALRNRYMSTCLLVYLTLGLAAGVLVALGGLGFPELFSVPGERHREATLVFWVIGLRAVVFNLPLGLFRGILFGERRIATVNLLGALGAMLYGVSAAVVLTRGGGIVALAAVNLACMLVEHLAYVTLAFREVEDLHLSPRLFDRNLLGEVLGFGACQLLVNLAALLVLRADPVVVKTAMSLEAVAVYAIGLKIAENLLLLIKQGVNVLAPVASELHGADDREGLGRLLRRSARMATAPAMLLCLAASVAAEPLIRLWAGPELVGGALVLVVLACTSALAVPGQVGSVLLAMSGHHAFQARLALAAAVVNVVVSLVLVRSLGLLGVALGTTVATLGVHLVGTLRYACRTYEIDLGGLAFESYARVLPAGALQILVSLALQTRFPPENLLVLGLELVPGALVFLGAFWVLGLEPGERQAVRDRLESVGQKLQGLRPVSAAT